MKKVPFVNPTLFLIYFIQEYLHRIFRKSKLLGECQQAKIIATIFIYYSFLFDEEETCNKWLPLKELRPSADSMKNNQNDPRKIAILN